MKRHAAIHTGIKPFKCSLCDKCFNRRSTLTVKVQHTLYCRYRKKTNQLRSIFSSYICSINIQIHMRTHRGKTHTEANTSNESQEDSQDSQNSQGSRESKHDLNEN